MGADGDGQGLRIREAKHATLRAAGQDSFPGQGSRGAVSLLDAQMRIAFCLLEMMK
jgi:hypothetical protein